MFEWIKNNANKLTGRSYERRPSGIDVDKHRDEMIKELGSIKTASR